ncbi:TetR/AcrR family transcriptional regulator [Shimia abyssi]|uniref:TetR family transcriptional regulator n=1 Tax=Shimia abyssi TaxID=1662395 RepID=A0A2P8FB58_9RHOB|nr:TetR/AcrR family transcriptional regulator [Shimia abyssi]PSL18960.1 TetR family transcriptional regulator [Shimia abyssi]
MNESSPIIRKGRKFDQVLESARELFLQHGFEGIGVDEIARKAGVSKATLYAYFPDKRHLFMEVARLECIRQADHLEAQVDREKSVPEVLRVVGKGFMEIILSDFGRNMFRVVVAEGHKFPELGQQFYESGPAVMRAGMVEFLECSVERGELVIDDVELAADQFPELCKAGVFLRLVTGIQTEFSEEEIDRTVEGAIETFMARFGA